MPNLGTSIGVGAGEGAATGAVAGPFGAIVGGIAGAAGGFLGYKKAPKAPPPPWYKKPQNEAYIALAGVLVFLVVLVKRKKG